MKIKINELVIKKRMRSVKPEKVEAIAGSIKEVGLITPICVNSDLELVAGLHRVEAAKLLGWKEIECNVVDFNSELRQLLAEIDENLQRSDLSVLERSDWLKERKRIYEELYPETKQKTGSELVERRWNTNAESAFVKESFTTTTAKVTGQSKRTIETEIQIANNIDEDVKEILKDTELANQKTNLLELSKVAPEQQKVIAKKVIEKPTLTVKEAIKEVRQDERKQVRKELAEFGKTIKIDVDFRLGDFEKVLADVPDGSIDCIITDPPYPFEFIECWSKLGRFAKRVLKPNGYCIAYSGQMHLPDVMKRMSEHLDYYWTFAVYHEGQTQIVNGVNLICRWKPILIYQNGKKKIDTTIQDYFISEQREKHAHDWQQSESGVGYLIEKFTNPGETILEPFAGGGTTIKVAIAKNRQIIAAEINEETYNIAKSNIQ